MAYADPPYPGQAKKHYGQFGGSEVDHRLLVARLELEYPDGWALSTSSTALRDVLALCPADARVMAWVKPFASFKPGVNPAYAWEPVIVRGGRPYGREAVTVRDWVAANITMQTGMPGAKPEAFCFWLFAALNLHPGDEFDDLYPGSGAVARAWEKWQRQLWPVRSLFAGTEAAG